MAELDRLLGAARDAMPDPLDEGQTDALVVAARQRREVAPAAVERVLERARGAEPSALSERELRALVQHASVAGNARHRRWTLVRVGGVVTVAAMAAAAAVTLAVLPSSERAASPSAEQAPAPSAEPRHAARDRPVAVSEPTDLDLPTGDRLMAAPGARFDVALEDPRARRVRLGEGSMLFDVRRIERARFQVTTPTAELEVLGTVFSVHASADATTVWVYEGAVRVRGEGGTRVVAAGEVWHVGAGEAGEDALVDAGRDAAARRTRGPIAIAEPVGAAEASRGAAPSPAARAPEATGLEVPAPVDATDATPATAQSLIARGDAVAALAVATDAIARGGPDAWRMVEGDALRALGRLDEAAEAYGRAARALPAPRRQQAGFLEARLRAGELADPEGALRALRAADVTVPDSVLRERGLALEVQLLTRLGRRAEAAAVASAYVGAFPEGPDADAMRAHASQTP